MTCPVCSRENPDGSVFCGGCGKTLACAACGAPAPDGESRFCDRCGRELALPTGAPPTSYPHAYAQPLYPQYQRAQTNGFAVASLVLGILWLYWVGSILALVFGYKAKRSIERSNGAEEGRGLAIAGIVLGWIGVGVLALLLVFVVIAIATGSEVPIEDGDYGHYDAADALASLR